MRAAENRPVEMVRRNDSWRLRPQSFAPTGPDPVPKIRATAKMFDEVTRSVDAGKYATVDEVSADLKNRFSSTWVSHPEK